MTRSGGLPPNLYIKSRLGASLVYDSTVNAGLFRNRDPQPGQLARPNSWITLNESASLPPAPEELANYTAALSSSKSGSNSDTSPMLEAYVQMDEGHWPWQVIVIIGYTCAGIQVAALPGMVSTYTVDSYKPVAGSLFVSITVNKNV
jgi:hypothetical protein